MATHGPTHDSPDDARAASSTPGNPASAGATTAWLAPVMLPSDVAIDYKAEAHLAALTAQTLNFLELNTCWQSMISAALHTMLESLTADLLQRLADTHAALYAARKRKPETKPLERVTTAQSHRSKASAVTLDHEVAPRETEAELYARARSLLSEGKRKLTRLSLQVKVEADDEATPSCTFVPTLDVAARDLFACERPIGKEAEEWTVTGGHFALRCEGDEAESLEQALRVLAFAALQLLLEAHLLRDLSCARPPQPPSPDQPSAPFPSTSPVSEASPPLSTAHTSELLPYKPSSALARRPSPLVSLPANAASLHRKRLSGANIWTMLKGRTKGQHEPEGPTWPLSARSETVRAGEKPKRGSRIKKVWEVQRSKFMHKKRKGEDGEDWTVVDEEEARDPLDPAPLRTCTSEPALSKMAIADVDAPPVPDKPVVTIPPLPTVPAEVSLAPPTHSSTASSASSVLSSSSITSATTPTRRSHKSSPGKSTKAGNVNFAGVIETMQHTILSVSPGVSIPPPHLLVRLRQQELAEQEGEHDHEHPLAATGQPTLVRQRSFTAADARALASDFASHSVDPISLPATPFSTISRATGTKTPKMTADTRSGVRSLLTNNNSLQGQTRHQCLQYLFERTRRNPEPGTPMCVPPKWRTVPYYYGSMDLEADQQLPTRGLDRDVVLSDMLAEMMAKKDEACACGQKMEEHVTSIIHGDTRVQLRLAEADAEGTEEEGVVMWTSCTECAKSSPPTIMSAATGLMSFTKLLELLIYDVHMLPDPTDSCEHASSDPHCAVRNFRKGETVLSMSLVPVTMYELRLPMPLTLAADAEGLDDPPTPAEERDESEVETIAKELQRFYASLRKRLADMEAICDALAADKSAAERKKALTALEQQHADKDAQLALVRHVRATGLTSLNDARYALAQRIEAAVQAVKTWEATHIDKKMREKVKLHELDVPVYTKPLCHALPAGNSVLVREDEPASIIAFALSSQTFREEIKKRRDPTRMRRVMGRESRTTSPLLESSSVFSSPASGNTAANSRSGSPDGTPVKSTSIQPVKSTFSDKVEVEKAEDLRQMRSFLAMRTLGKQQSADSFASRVLSSGIRIVSDPLSLASTSTAASEVSVDAIASRPAVSKRENDADLLEALLTANEPLTTSSTPAATLKTKRSAVLPKLMADLVTPDRRHASAASIASTATDVSGITISATHTPLKKAVDPNFAMLLESRLQPGQLPLFPEDEEEGDDIVPELTEGSIGTHLASTASAHSLASLNSDTTTATLAPTEVSRTSFLPSLPWSMGTMRQRPGGMSRSMSVQQLTTDADPEPHLRYSMQEGDLKISVTAFHAARFAVLRRMCGVHEEQFINSLSRCTKWEAAGGKSKAAFFMTGDRRFVLKTMSDEWSSSEKASMLDFSGGYFRHFLEQSDAKPSLIAKIFGVYSLSVKHGTGEEAKLDLVVLENLFSAHKPSRTYDLKGIASRAAKTGEKGTKADVLWDSDWVRNANVVLVHAHSKKIISEAVANDTAFLAREQIQDYSALLGVSDDEHTLILGIIDVLSSYGIAKAVEHKAKSVLRNAADVTVLPPLEYAERFRKALDSYFVAAPEKWSAPPGGPEVLDRPLSCPL